MEYLNKGSKAMYVKDIKGVKYTNRQHYTE